MAESKDKDEAPLEQQHSRKSLNVSKQPEENRFLKVSTLHQAVTLGDHPQRKYVETKALWAADLLQQLTKTDTPDAPALMPKAVLNACEGLAFIDMTKGGFFLNVAGGDGFVIQKLTQDRFGNSTWSAPLFLSVYQYGIGVTAGYQRSKAIIAIMTRGTVRDMATSRFALGTDLVGYTTNGGLSGAPAGTLGTTKQLEVTADNQEVAFTYSVCSGALINLSFVGTNVFPNARVNKRLYGNTTTEEILAGTQQTFTEMAPLYRSILELARQAATS